MKPTPEMIEAGAIAGDVPNHKAEEIISAALSVQPAAAVVGEPVAWLHPTANWSHVDRERVAMHCSKDGPLPIPLYAAPSSPDGVDEQALDKAAREGYAVRCKTHGPRVLDQYASADIMRMQLDDARVIVAAYLAALGGSHD